MPRGFSTLRSGGLARGDKARGDKESREDLTSMGDKVRYGQGERRQSEGGSECFFLLLPTRGFLPPTSDWLNYFFAITCPLPVTEVRISGFPA
jgi:hypothetical protein